jgi:hypothetical protein
MKFYEILMQLSLVYLLDYYKKLYFIKRMKESILHEQSTEFFSTDIKFFKSF